MRDFNEFVRTESPPRFFGLDIDRTFYVDDKEVFDRNKNSIVLLKSKGIVPFFATNRYYDSAMALFGQDLVNKTGYNGYPGVYSNGCCVFDEHGNVLFLRKFSKEFLEKYLDYIKENRLEDRVVFVSPHFSFMISKPHEEIEQNIQIKNIHQPEVMTIEDVYKNDIVCVRNIKIESQVTQFEGGKDCFMYVYGNVLTLSPPGISKADGIKHLLTHYNAKPSDCAYIGDSENDIQAMEYCGLSFAVGNAKDEVKQHANWVVDLTSEQGAFAKVVEVVYGD